MQIGVTPGLTPVDTRKSVFLGATGVRKNAKTPCFTGFSIVRMLYEAAALTAELRRQVKSKYWLGSSILSFGSRILAKTKSNFSFPAKPSKPYPKFPLFAHAAGRWVKKIRGRIVYFGPWDDPDAALTKHQEQKDVNPLGSR